MESKLRVLFLCTHNSCRSQMAEGWAKLLKSKTITAQSAGLEASSLDSRAMEVMAEAGVCIALQRSKSVRELARQPFDLVVTLCDGASRQCPAFPGGTRVVHKGFDDPAVLAKGARTDAEAKALYRRVRDEIRLFVEGLPDNLGPDLDSVGRGKYLE